MTAKHRKRRSTSTFSCGHPRTPENTRVGRGRGYTWGKCRICNNAYMRAYMRQRNLERRVRAEVARALAAAKRKQGRADQADA